MGNNLKYRSRALVTAKYALNSEFSPILKEQMVKIAIAIISLLKVTMKFVLISDINSRL